ncbi:MAG: hypothetical protein AABW79_01975 [Nanoarchaeota archaeon]
MVGRGQAWDFFTKLIIGVLVLVIVMGIYMVLSGKYEGAIEFFRNLLRFG